jgi:nucleoside phosphorylase
VRRGLSRAKSSLRVVSHGIGPLAAASAADRALGAGAFGSALSTGLCGLLSPAFLVGDALVYREMHREACATLVLERTLGDAVARRVPGSQSGVRALERDTILCSAEQKRAAAAHFRTEAVDMESYALAEHLQRAGVAVAVLRVGSDGPGDELPELDRALTGSGDIDSFALALAMMRAPMRAANLARNGLRALAALEDAIYHIAAAA